MKKLRQFCAAVVLILTLALSTFAGEISCPGVVSQPPPPQQSSATGDILCPGVTSTGNMPGPGVAALDPATEFTLSLLESVLYIF